MNKLILIVVFLFVSVSIFAKSIDIADYFPTKEGYTWTYKDIGTLEVDERNAITLTVTYVKSKSEKNVFVEMQKHAGDTWHESLRYLFEGNLIKWAIPRDSLESIPPDDPLYNFWTIKLTLPGRQWDGNNTKYYVEKYFSKNGSISFDGKTYNDCIVISTVGYYTVDGKSREHREYYAKGIGFVCATLIENGKEVVSYPRLVSCNFAAEVQYQRLSASDFNVRLTDDGAGVIITKYTGTMQDCTIPSKIQNLPVRVIGEGAFSNDKNIVRISIPQGVAEIGAQAFYGCTKLTTVELPNTITKIGNKAFMNSSIQKISLPPNKVDFGVEVFSRCTQLKTIVIPDWLTQIPPDSFAGCSSLEEVKLPAAIQLIGPGAFENCAILEKVTLPESVARIQFPATLQWGIGTNFYGPAFTGCARLSLASKVALQRVGYTGGF